MPQDTHARFVALHAAHEPLLLPNCWDAASARLWQECGARAVATASAAVAWSRGHADGGDLPPESVLQTVGDILRCVTVPVSVDIEAGYSDDPAAVAALVETLAGLGVAGVNLEDGGGAPDLLVAKIAAIRARGPTVFVNARTDVYLRQLAQGEAAVAMTIERLERYRQAGADGGFVPGLVDAADARRIAGAVPLALNVMALPGLAPLQELAAAGVRRVSVGPGLFKVGYAAAQEAARAFLAGEPSALSRPGLDYAAMNRLFAAP